MQFISQAKRKAGTSGEPLPNPFGDLANEGIHLRRSQLHLLTAAPGTGKSALILGWMMRTSSVRVLYISSDTDAAVQYKRMACMSTGYSSDYIDQQMEHHPEELDAIIRNAGHHITFDFNPYPNGDEVLDQVNAYLEVYGVYPDVIIQDNLKNLRLEDASRSGEFDELEGNMEFLQLLARETGAAVITLHHVTGYFESGDQPIPLSGIRGKVTKTPEVVLTLHRSPGYTLISPVKNRDGRGDASGGFCVAVSTDLSRMRYGIE